MLEGKAPVHLYNLDGSLNLSKDFLDTLEREQLPLAKQYQPSKIITPTFMQHRPLLKTRTTIFEPYWVATDETAFDEFTRQHFVRDKKFHTRWGGNIHCVWAFLAVTCTGVPTPAWKKPVPWRPSTEIDEVDEATQGTQ